MSDNYTQKLIDKFCQDPAYVDVLTYVENIDSFLLYDKDEHYHKILSDRQMMKILYKYFKYSKQANKNISESLISDLMWHASMSCYREVEEMPTTHMAFQDKLLNLNTLTFEDFNIDAYAYHKIPFKTSDINMPTPVFDKFMMDICVKEDLTPDPEMKTIMQEMFGYYIMGGKLTGEAFFLKGGGNNGKSIILFLLSEIIGKEYITSMTIQSLTGNRFKTLELIGKKLNVCGDEEGKFISTGLFKQLLTGDRIDAEKKYKGSLSFIPTAKYLFALNKLPSLDQIGKNIQRRFKIINFYRTIEEKDQDKFILEKLKKEMAGIVKWSLIGAKRFKENNYIFSKCDNLEESYREFEEQISSAAMFFRETFVDDEKGFVAIDDIYELYKEWCINNGRKPMSKYNMGKDISEVSSTKSIVKWSAEHNKNMRGRQIKYKGSESNQAINFEEIPI